MSAMVERSVPSFARRIAAAALVLAVFIPAGLWDRHSVPDEEISDHGEESEIPSIMTLPELGAGLRLVSSLAQMSSAGPGRPPLRPPTA